MSGLWTLLFLTGTWHQYQHLVHGVHSSYATIFILKSCIYYSHITNASEIPLPSWPMDNSHHCFILHHLTPHVCLIHHTYSDTPQFHGGL